MDLNLTQHADKILRQRGINNKTLEYIYLYGDVQNAPGGAQKIFLSRKGVNKEIKRLKMNHKNTGRSNEFNNLKHDIKCLERAAGKCIIEKDGQILTVYNRN